MKKLFIIMLVLLQVGLLGMLGAGCNGDSPPADEVYEEES